jgi:cytidine deaminase
MGITRVSETRALLQAARDGMRFSYSPYSKVQVGAAVLTKSGEIVTGCNIENAAYGATVCAERVAIFRTISQGELQIVAIAIASSSGHAFPPCGACRQVMYELAKDADLVMEDKDGEPRVMRVICAFRPS